MRTSPEARERLKTSKSKRSVPESNKYLSKKQVLRYPTLCGSLSRLEFVNDTSEKKKKTVVSRVRFGYICSVHQRCDREQTFLGALLFSGRAFCKWSGHGKASQIPGLSIEAFLNPASRPTLRNESHLHDPVL